MDNTIFAYWDGLYLNERQLMRAERVGKEEAEQFEVPKTLPAAVYRLDRSARLFFDFDEVLAEMVARKWERLAAWQLSRRGARYIPSLILERPPTV